MSSKHLENSRRGADQANDRFLNLLKTRGPRTAADFGQSFGITDEAARQQLVKLGNAGLVEAISEAKGVGRPAQVWQLTPAGHARFPDSHAELTVQLIKTIREELGEEALDKLIAAREKSTLTTYNAEVASAPDLAERVARLAAIRTAEGYMAEWQEDGEGFLLLENHCPICAAAAICQGFCRAELEIFQAVLGPDTSVRRTEHILAGARRCAYRITLTGM
jgi:predicted ArsR family transcriptional regulator